MNKLFIYRVSKSYQYLLSATLIILIAAGCYILSGILDYKTVALILLISVSLIASLFDLLPVLLSAFLSALLWDYFFIPPKFTFSVGSTEDTLMLFMYFVIASLNAVMTFKIRQAEKRALKKEEKDRKSVV